MSIIPERPSWTTYYLGVASAVAQRGDCTRMRVGAVIVDRHNRIVSTGYNGTEPGGKSCLRGECPRGRQDHETHRGDPDFADCVAIHAETNAVVYAARTDMVGGTIFVSTADGTTVNPCHNCEKLIKAAGIMRTICA